MRSPSTASPTSVRLFGFTSPVWQVKEILNSAEIFPVARVNDSIIFHGNKANLLHYSGWNWNSSHE